MVGGGNVAKITQNLTTVYTPLTYIPLWRHVRFNQIEILGSRVQMCFGIVGWASKTSTL